MKNDEKPIDKSELVAATRGAFMDQQWEEFWDEFRDAAARRNDAKQQVEPREIRA